nr:hypothetical protein [Anaerolineae bacterium]
ARLFLVPGTPLHPYESVQRGEGRLWGELTVQVQSTYREAGLQLVSEENQVPDHLTVELEFMEHLAGLEADRWLDNSPGEAETLRETQRAFLCDHLGAWAITFAQSLRDETLHPYFQFLAQLLETVVESDLAFLLSSTSES